MTFRLAAIQPRAFSEADEHRNVELALRWLERAAEARADLVVFPEGFPGPTNPLNDFDATGPLCRKASQFKLHIVANGIEPAGAGCYYVRSLVIDDCGDIVATYRRTSPTGPYIYRDIPAWDFDYVAGDEPPAAVSTWFGRFGILTCSEVYVPELSRLLALQGVDLIVFPSGGAINELLSTWRTMVWARSIENTIYTAAVQNLYAADEEGVGTIASPEAVVAARSDEGMLVADIDTDRLQFLRDRDEHVEFPKPYRTPPGLARWRRPELYAELASSRTVCH